jgi:hypothetical protein
VPGWAVESTRPRCILLVLLTHKALSGRPSENRATARWTGRLEGGGPLEGGEDRVRRKTAPAVPAPFTDSGGEGQPRFQTPICEPISVTYSPAPELPLGRGGFIG